MLGEPKVENEHFLNLVYGLALGALALINGGLGWFLNMLHARTEKTSSDLSAFKQEVAKEYASKDDLKEIVRDMKIDLRDIKEHLMGTNGNGNGGRKK